MMTDNSDHESTFTSEDQPYDLHTFHMENCDILKATMSVRKDTKAADSLTDGVLDADMAETLTHDVLLVAQTVFTHYRRKEELILPQLEHHGEQSLSKGMWDRDDQARSFVYTALTLIPGIRKRPSSGNLGSVAGLLEDASDAIDTMVAEEESELIPKMHELLGNADWQQISDGIGKTATVQAEDPTTWRPSPIDMTEARMRILGLGK